MAEFDGWGPAVSRRLRSGSPASEIVKVAEELPADLIVVAAGARGLTSTILLGSTAQKIQHSSRARCWSADGRHTTDSRRRSNHCFVITNVAAAVAGSR